MNTINIAVVLKNGAVDRDAMTASLATALDKYEAELATQSATVAEAISAVFDEHLGKKITMPVLANFACAKLNAQPENFAQLSELALDYVRVNSKGDSSLFVIAKGKNGGVARRSDLPVPAPESK